MPQPDSDGDKEERGRVLILGGSPQLPGAVLLAGNAALRAGAGKLQIATGRSVAPLVAVQIPEARVIALPEDGDSGFAPSAAEALFPFIGQADAVLIGPGITDAEAIRPLIQQILPHMEAATLTADAGALELLQETPTLFHSLEGKAILTPHAGEMAQMLNAEKETIRNQSAETVRQAVERFQAVVALKGAETSITGPNQALYLNRVGNTGLATSGSGDVLAGIIAGLAARGAEPLQAAVWGVYLHACAGDRLARRIGPLGFLARELPDEIPALMSELSPTEK